MVRDLTVGNPLRKILGFCLPILAGSLFQQVYFITDCIIVGHYLGVASFAAVGSTTALNLLVLGFGLGACSGLSIPVAQYVGAGDVKSLRRAAINGLYLIVILSVLMAVVMSFLSRPILLLLGTPADLLDEACRYISTAFVCAFAVLLFNLVISYLRSVGDSRTPLLYLILACALNVLLDLLFIAVLHTGVEGVAWATALSQLLSLLLCLRTIYRHFPILCLTKEEARPSFTEMGKLCRIAVPMGLQFSFTAVGSIFVQSAVNGLGAAAVAATTAVNRVQAVLLAALESSGVAMATFASQNHGAGSLDRVRSGVKQATLVFSAYCIVVFFVNYFLASSLAEVFLSRTEVEIHALVSKQLFLASFFYIPLALIYMFRNTLQGLGCTNAVMITGLLETTGRILMSLLFVPQFGFTAVCFASPLAWVMADAFLLPTYLRTMRKLHPRLPAA